jgi:hypothetical protein
LTNKKKKETKQTLKKSTSHLRDAMKTSTAPPQEPDFSLDQLSAQEVTDVAACVNRWCYAKDSNKLMTEDRFSVFHNLVANFVNHPSIIRHLSRCSLEANGTSTTSFALTGSEVQSASDGAETQTSGSIVVVEQAHVAPSLTVRAVENLIALKTVPQLLLRIVECNLEEKLVQKELYPEIVEAKPSVDSNSHVNKKSTRRKPKAKKTKKTQVRMITGYVVCIDGSGGRVNVNIPPTAAGSLDLFKLIGSVLLLRGIMFYRIKSNVVGSFSNYIVPRLITFVHIATTPPRKLVADQAGLIELNQRICMLEYGASLDGRGRKSDNSSSAVAGGTQGHASSRHSSASLGLDGTCGNGDGDGGGDSASSSGGRRQESSRGGGHGGGDGGGGSSDESCSSNGGGGGGDGGGGGGGSDDENSSSNGNDDEDEELADFFVVLSKELDKEFEPVLDGASELKCDGCCSQGPHQFSDCIVKQMPPKDVDIQEIRMKCTWATINATLPHNHLRNLLYFWYATVVFCHTHAGTRKPLPRCLVAAIRALFPNLAGTRYVGFQAESALGRYGMEDGGIDLTPGLTDAEEEERKGANDVNAAAHEEEERQSANAAVNAAAYDNDSYDFAGIGDN